MKSKKKFKCERNKTGFIKTQLRWAIVGQQAKFRGTKLFFLKLMAHTPSF